MILIRALLLALTANLASGRIWSPITWPFAYPLINGTIVGIVMGEPLLGMQAGATINLAYIGWISAGGTMPSNIGIAGVYGTAITILANASPELGITLAVPIGLLGVLLWQLQMTLNAFWVHRLDKNAENAEINKVWLNAAVFPQLTSLVINGTPAFLLLYLGQDVFVNLISNIPEHIINALTVVGGLLPALGVAMLLNYLGNKRLFPYFVIGFFLAAYLELDLLAIAILGASIAFIQYFADSNTEETYEDEDFDDDFENITLDIKLTRGDKIKHWLLGLGAEIGYNYERMQASGNLLAMVPIIKRLYTDPEEISAAMKRYLIFFNTEPSFIGPVIPGVAVSLEEKRANGAKEITGDMINGLRTGLMGPLAGIGDSLAGGIIYPVGISIGVSLALDANSFLGPLFFFVFFTGIMIVLSFTLYRMGYNQGGNAITRLLGSGNNSIVKLTDSFGVVGLLVIGAMGANFVTGYTPLAFEVGQTSIVLQDVINGLVPNLIPFLIIMGTYYMLRKRISPTIIILTMAGVGILAYYLNLLGVPPTA